MAAYTQLMSLIDSNNESQITQELCHAAIRDNPNIKLTTIPYRFRTKEICMKYLIQDPAWHKHVPTEFIDKDMWAHILKRDGDLINRGMIPDEIINQEMYENAVIYGELKLKRVPHKFRNKEICIHTIRHSESYIDELRYIPTCLINDESAFQQFAQELYNRLIRESNCYSFSFESIPIKFKTKEICISCLNCNAALCKYIPSEFIDKEMWYHLVKRDGNIINMGNIPQELLNQEMYETAVIHGRLSIKAVPHEFRNKEICLYVLRYGWSNSDIFNHIPGYIRDNTSLHHELVSACGLYLGHLPREDRTPDICKAAIKQTPSAAKYLPKNPELIPMITELIEHDELCKILDCIPKYFKTRDFYLKIVSIRGRLLSTVPNEMKDVEICKVACQNDPTAKIFVTIQLPDKVFDDTDVDTSMTVE